MRYFYLEKSNFGKFVDSLKKGYRIVAPVKKENLFVFSEIESLDEIALEYVPTILPPKKYLLPQREPLGTFKTGDIKMSPAEVDMRPTTIFAAHTCDIDGLECLEAAFHDGPVDPYYKARRKSVFVVGYECMHPCDKYATCITMGTDSPKSGYDAMITDAGNKYILHVNSSVGLDVLAGNNSLFEADDIEAKKLLQILRAEKMKKFDRKLAVSLDDFPRMFAKSYNSLVWEDVGKRCVSCGNCTAVCPTCYCFDIYDEVKLDLSGGERKRIWDSCQLDEFASVAGGENFRKERKSRQRHRYYRKFDYPVRKYRKYFCTGCGRCTRTCMAGINLIETINSLEGNE